MFKEKSTNTSLCGNEWLPICRKCHEEVKECCIDVELTLFPDEIESFKKEDPKNLKEFQDGTFGYDKSGKCCFLASNNQCQLQILGIRKPLDCLIFPINYKNGKIFIENSCWAKELLLPEEAIDYLKEKLKEYPIYTKINYKLSDSDSFLMNIPVI